MKELRYNWGISSLEETDILNKKPNLFKLRADEDKGETLVLVREKISENGWEVLDREIWTVDDRYIKGDFPYGYRPTFDKSEREVPVRFLDELYEYF